jgi:hypothetical protein
MIQFRESPVEDVTLGEAMKISLDHYYELLKKNAGGLEENEFLQLRLISDPVDVSNKDEGYTWFSKYNLLERADAAINPSPINSGVTISAKTLVSVYERFLNRLTQLVDLPQPNPEYEQQIMALDTQIKELNDTVLEVLAIEDSNWKRYCSIRGCDPTDVFMYTEWSSSNGESDRINVINNDITLLRFQRRRLFNKYYEGSDDKVIVEANNDFYSSGAKLKYPSMEDYHYLPQQINLAYLLRLPSGNTSFFQDRHVFNFALSNDEINSMNVGSFDVTLDEKIVENSSISEDWKASGRAGYGFLNVKVGGSGSKKIKDEFKKTNKIKLGAKATIKLKINYPNWFRPELFDHQKVKSNPELFTEFFGKGGSLLYYPLALILVKGFSVSFESTQKWTYDYEKKFRAKGGGGFRAFGVNFGASGGRSSHVKEHKVEQSDTTLTFKDDDDTLRFVGLSVYKNEPLEHIWDEIENNKF